VDVVRSLTNKDVFNFLSDEGLLPNYAFPEAGIILKAILYRKNDGEEEESEKKKYDKMVYEYNRSASSAISEFAPSNNFYAEGRKLTINQVDLTTAQSTKWRLCPACSHAEIEETGSGKSVCPQCESPAWSDSGQVRNMLKVHMVYSNMSYSESLIGDESDDRNSAFYCRQMLVDVNEDADITKAYRMDNDEFPFGYEFVRKATLREINFGERDITGERLSIAGTDDVRKGFKICKYCGKLQTGNEKTDHTYTCRARTRSADDAEPSEECLFLYREFVSEALRILVPATTMEFSNVRQESFIASFMLGMKEYFGNVDHLRACLSEVPVKDTGYRKQYLVIYDSVPGGTGYLKQLMLKEGSLIEILEKALSVMENCSCKDDPQKDGCYHCLYAYRQSQKIGDISRRTAIKMLRQILSGKSNLEMIPKLGSIPVNSLFDSELERMFIDVLGCMKGKSGRFEVSKELVNSKEGYLVKAGNSLWQAEPQVLLDDLYGVYPKSKADFVLWPVRVSAGQKPIAVFTDGFLFHKDKVADDTLKREAIHRTGKFRVWILSWKDVQSVLQPQGDYAAAVLSPEKMPFGPALYMPAVKHGNAEQLRPDKTSAMELLAQYMERPDAEELFAVHAKAFAMSLLDPKKISDNQAFGEWNKQINPILNMLAMQDACFEPSDTVFGKWIPGNSSHLTFFAGVDRSDFQTNKTNAVIMVTALLNDSKESRNEKYESDWNGFWHFFNVMQFLKSFAAVSTEGLKDMVYCELPAKRGQTTLYDEQDPISDEAWTEILEQIYDPSAKEFAGRLISLGAPAPSSIGYELENDNGEIVAECEMAWEMKNIALLLLDRVESKEKFEKHGWKVFTINDNAPDEIYKEVS
jgi:DEAD/DEAH box helicase domain-containing protein